MDLLDLLSEALPPPPLQWRGERGGVHGPHAGGVQYFGIMVLMGCVYGVHGLPKSPNTATGLRGSGVPAWGRTCPSFRNVITIIPKYRILARTHARWAMCGACWCPLKRCTVFADYGITPERACHVRGMLVPLKVAYGILGLWYHAGNSGPCAEHGCNNTHARKRPVRSSKKRQKQR